jgi:hypothetical protein
VEEIKIFKPGREDRGGISYCIGVEVYQSWTYNANEIDSTNFQLHGGNVYSWEFYAEGMFDGVAADFTAESFMLKECLLVSWLILKLRVLCCRNVCWYRG